MPYPRAHFYVLAVIAVIVAGFWPSYFSAVRSVPWQFHAHGISASLWVVMVALQSWTAHQRQLPLHRAIGMVSLLLFPFLIAGLAAIIDVTAKGYVAGEGPVRTMLGGSFMLGLAAAIAAYVTVFYRALKYRRKVWLHSGYMLTTPLILFESPFGRLVSKVLPSLTAGIDRIIPTILGSMVIELAVVAIIWWHFREKALPFLVAAGFILLQMIGMGLLGDWAPATAALRSIGHLPSAIVVLSGFLIGALTSWCGWQSGKQPAGPIAGAPQPA